MKTKEEKAEYARNWYQKHLKRERLKRKVYNQRYMKRFLEWEKKYRRTPPGFYAHVKKMALRNKREFDLEKQWFLNWLKEQGAQCCYCKRELKYTAKKETAPSIDRIDNLKGYLKTNIVLCCARCNIIKNDLFTYDEMMELGKTIAKIHQRRIKCL